MLDAITLERFTAFEHFSLKFAHGLNVFIGETGCGKTHLLKVLYAACEASRSQKSFAEKLNRVFMPSGEQIGRLVRAKSTPDTCGIEVTRTVNAEGRWTPLTLRLSMSSRTKAPAAAILSGACEQWQAHPLTSVYVSVEDVIANALGLRSIRSPQHNHFDEVDVDLIDRVLLDAANAEPDQGSQRLLELLQQSMDGTVMKREEEFFLKGPQGELEFTLLAEGMRKLGLLWVLIQNGSLAPGSVLLWDEPAAGLNPRLMGLVVQILVELQRSAVQVFVSTHNYNLLKEFDLQLQPNDQVLFHSLFRDDRGQVQVNSSKDYEALQPNSIDDTLGHLTDREIRQQLGRLGQ